MAFLAETESPRTDKFRAACAGRFALATVFLPPTELAAARKAVVAPADPVAQMLEDKAEVIS